MKKAWDTLTQDGSISDITVVSEKTNRDVARVALDIRYQNRMSHRVEELARFSGGRWWATLVLQLRSVQPNYIRASHYEQFAKAVQESKLQDQHSLINGSHVEIRLPPGCQWKEKENSMHCEKLGVYVSVIERTAYPDSLLLTVVDEHWKKTDFTLLEKETLPQGTLYDGEWSDPEGTVWVHTELVMGDQSRSAWISVKAPKHEGIQRFVREMLKSTRFQKQ
jgi:hypothetical protein